MVVFILPYYHNYGIPVIATWIKTDHLRYMVNALLPLRLSLMLLIMCAIAIWMES